MRAVPFMERVTQMDLQYILLPSCECGNIGYFDITPSYVQIGINWPIIKVEDENNWKEIVLKEIKILLFF